MAPFSRSIPKITNKARRQTAFIEKKREVGKDRRIDRLKRRKAENANPQLKALRLAKNKTVTLEDKRVWDETVAEDFDSLPLDALVDVESVRRRQLERERDQAVGAEPIDWDAEDDEHTRQALRQQNGDDGSDDDDDDDDDDNDSMLASDEENDDDEGRSAVDHQVTSRTREGSVAPSTTGTNLSVTPASLAAKFPRLFADDDADGDEPKRMPKVLVTTSINAHLHDEALMLCDIFPNATYVRRTPRRGAHKYSLREIAQFASNRDYTALVMLNEDRHRPSGLTLVMLPEGPTATFTMTNWLPGKYIPGHGCPTDHIPELLLNGFKTPLGILTAKMLSTIFPPQPEIAGRQVVTFHTQRDYIFFRRHRYAYRERRDTEKKAVGVDGRAMKGVEDIRTGLQELGPRFTLKLRRVDKGIGRAGSAGDDALAWEWKNKMEKERTRFNL